MNKRLRFIPPKHTLAQRSGSEMWPSGSPSGEKMRTPSSSGDMPHPHHRLPSMSHLSARQEYRQLLEALRLPISERAAARRAAVAAFAETNTPKFEHMASTN